MTRALPHGGSSKVSADPTRPWSIEDALNLYNVREWGKGYFGINKAGHVTVHPDKQPARAIDVKQLIDNLTVRGIHTPVLLRFTDILRHRVSEIAAAFKQAIRENEYQGDYRCVYPIKVNQQRRVVEEICDFGADHGFGLEAGSKPELLTVLAVVGDRDVPIICNGFKDDEFIEMVILAQKLGKKVIPVVEKFSELKLIIKHAAAHGVRPSMGIRVKLSARGAGRWETSGGARSKFGLFVSELVDALDHLREHDMTDCLHLLHFHLGSQINNIRNVKEAVNELARVYVQMKQYGAGLKYIDVGGGLGVDYDGSQTAYDSSMNYTLAEYASDVVYRIKTVCDDAEVEHPTIISESGRAMVAYHTMLVFDVLGVSGLERFDGPETLPNGDDVPQPLIDLCEAHKALNKRNLIESYHDALQAYDQALSLFNLGHLALDQRAYAEKTFWAVCAKIARLVKGAARVPEELQGLADVLSDTYFCNVSIFQSLPDSWAIDQLFPIMPIHRLTERPKAHGTLADITCDSDGKIDKFPDIREDKSALELHEYDGSPYYIGAFLIGAYQEILGDMHNLLGDTHVVHVTLDEDDEVSIDKVLPGDMVRDVLSYVGFDAKDLAEAMRQDVEKAVKRKKLTARESALFMRFYEAGLDGYTYLE
jgi:arginine decarboxylase